MPFVVMREARPKSAHGLTGRSSIERVKHSRLGLARSDDPSEPVELLDALDPSYFQGAGFGKRRASHDPSDVGHHPFGESR